MADKQKDFSIRLEIKEVLNEHGIQASEEQIDDILEGVCQWDDLMTIISYFVKLEVQNFAKETKQKSTIKVDPKGDITTLDLLLKTV